MKCRWISCLVVCAIGVRAQGQDDYWLSLFDGKTLKGWVQKGGKAKFRVEDGCIVGRPVPKEPDSYLCSTDDYRDFILEFDFKISPGLVSGVQFRSLCLNEDTEFQSGELKIKIPAKQVHGCQYDIDPTESPAETGGVFDEGRRGWLAQIDANEAAQSAYKPNAWNKGRIECRAAKIKTWINGVLAVDFSDAATMEGFIALNVQSLGEEPPSKGDIRWRNIRIHRLQAEADK